MCARRRSHGHVITERCPASLHAQCQPVQRCVLTLMLGWALSVLTRLCSVSKPSLMLKRLFCSAEMCVMRRLSICRQQRWPWASPCIGDRLAPSMHQAWG